MFFVALLGLVLVALSFLIQKWQVRSGIYRRVPVEHYGLLTAAAFSGGLAFFQQATILNGLLLLVELLGLLGLVWYVHWGSILRRSPIRLQLGDRFPDVTLPDSSGRAFDTRQLRGDKSSLVLFFRGDW